MQRLLFVVNAGASVAGPRPAFIKPRQGRSHRGDEVKKVGSLSLGYHVHATAFTIEHDVPVDQREKGVIVALPNAFASVELRTNLANQDVPGADAFPTKFLHAPSLSV